MFVGMITMCPWPLVYGGSKILTCNAEVIKHSLA